MSSRSLPIPRCIAASSMIPAAIFAFTMAGTSVRTRRPQHRLQDSGATTTWSLEIENRRERHWYKHHLRYTFNCLLPPSAFHGAHTSSTSNIAAPITHFLHSFANLTATHRNCQRSLSPVPADGVLQHHEPIGMRISHRSSLTQRPSSGRSHPNSIFCKGQEKRARICIGHVRGDQFARIDTKQGYDTIPPAQSPRSKQHIPWIIGGTRSLALRSSKPHIVELKAR